MMLVVKIETICYIDSWIIQNVLYLSRLIRFYTWHLQHVHNEIILLKTEIGFIAILSTLNNAYINY